MRGRGFVQESLIHARIAGPRNPGNNGLRMSPGGVPSVVHTEDRRAWAATAADSRADPTLGDPKRDGEPRPHSHRRAISCARAALSAAGPRGLGGEYIIMVVADGGNGDAPICIKAVADAVGCQKAR